MLNWVPTARRFCGGRRLLATFAITVLTELSMTGCSGYAQGFLDPVEDGLGGAPGEPEPLECPSDCPSSPCPILFVLRASEVFSQPGELKVHGEDDGWVYATVESGRTLIRVRECGPAREVQVVARTESAFHDIAVGRHVVHAALSAGRIFRLEAEEWSPTLVTQFEMAGAATLEQVPSGGFLALTQTLDGVVHVAPDGTSRSVADVGVAASPLVIPINSGIVAQRTSPDGRTQIIRIPDTGEPELVLAGGAEGELELLDARDKGILFRRKLDGTTRVISYVSTKGGNILDLIRGPIDGPARWTQLGIVYSTEETNDNGLPVTRLREATAGLGSQLLEATDGRFLFDGVTSLYSSGRRLFITTDTGLLFRQTFRPRQP